MKNFVLALGFFDAIHIGHRYLLAKAKALALSLHTKLLVLTFDDNFLSTLGKDSKEIYLFEEKKEILLELGVDFVEKLPSSKEFLQLSKNDYLQFLSLTYQPQAIVAGNDYRFGKNAEGNIHDLMQFFTDTQTSVHICDLLQTNSHKVASTDIRKMLESGEIEAANKLLAQPFFISGVVEHGHNIGSKLNFPTANISFDTNKIIPKLGVYYVKIKIDGKLYKGIANVGNRPTFWENKIKVESFIINFDKQIYGKKITVYLHKYIREIKKFDNLAQLQEQIKKDFTLVEGIND